jgi:GT2 family glycosyltransferase
MPNRDNGWILDRTLERLVENTAGSDYELIVIDDGSADDSRDVLRRWGPRLPDLSVIEREHSGVADALNAGLNAASGDVVVQLDADATLETPGWLERLTAALAGDERVGTVTAQVFFDWGELHACGIDVTGPEGLHDRGSEIAEPVGRRTYHGAVRRRREGCAAPAEVDGGLGCCMAYRREAAVEAGGYDPGFNPVWFDDLDLTMSLRRLGLKVFCLPEVRAVHHVGERTGRRDSALRRALPAWLRRRPKPTHPERLAHHYAYWREKWGFDLLNPDVEELQRRWGGTEVCWRYDPERRRAGEEIVERCL